VGSAMAEPRQPAATIPCLICGYDLSGLPEEGVCPECAAPAGPSFRKNLFELTGTRHGRRVVRGLQLARDAAWAGLICFAAFILAAMTDSVLLTLIGGGVVIAAPVFVAGWWIATGRGGSALRP